jgi:putative two-component system response regulator
MENEKKLIVIVDDDPECLEAGKNVLEEKYNITAASSAAKLFDLLKNCNPDLVLLDIDMPEMSGYEAIKILKAKPETENIPVIFLVEESETDDGFEGLSLGGIDYITKPFRPPLLLKRVEVHLSVEDRRKILDRQTVELQNFKDNLHIMVEEKTQNIISLQNALLNTILEIIESRQEIENGHVEHTQQQIKVLLKEIKRSGLYPEET